MLLRDMDFAAPGRGKSRRERNGSIMPPSRSALSRSFFRSSLFFFFFFLSLFPPERHRSSGFYGVRDASVRDASRGLSVLFSFRIIHDARDRDFIESRSRPLSRSASRVALRREGGFDGFDVLKHENVVRCAENARDTLAAFTRSIQIARS